VALRGPGEGLRIGTGTGGWVGVGPGVGVEPVAKVHLENKTRIFFIESEAEVHGYAQQFHRLAAMALSPGDSVDMIKDAISELRKPGDDAGGTADPGTRTGPTLADHEFDHGNQREPRQLELRSG
jgi:Domain of unknown function (DUF5753)